MSGISSIIQIVLVEDKVGKKINPTTGQVSTWKEVRAILRKEDGTVATVGMMRVPRDLEGQVMEGTFTCGFGLGVRDYGDNKGEILPVITSLIPFDPKLLNRRPGAPVASPAPAAG